MGTQVGAVDVAARGRREEDRRGQEHRKHDRPARHTRLGPAPDLRLRHERTRAEAQVGEHHERQCEPAEPRAAQPRERRHDADEDHGDRAPLRPFDGVEHRTHDRHPVRSDGRWPRGRVRPRGADDPLGHGLACHGGAADALDAGRRGVDARDLLERHPAPEPAKRPVVAHVADVGLVVVARRHEHAGHAARRVEGDDRVGRALIADDAIGRWACAECPAEWRALAVGHADHRGLARVGRDRRGCRKDPAEVIE